MEHDCKNKRNVVASVDRAMQMYECPTPLKDAKEYEKLKPIRGEAITPKKLYQNKEDQNEKAEIILIYPHQYPKQCRERFRDQFQIRTLKEREREVQNLERQIQGTIPPVRGTRSDTA
mmetsp:Transcript_37319/g.72313  ORF Transcript_37319/g.72313 Transcript_37319/m.72313 type:complete len:118 (-) Transcript_37319:277-630(-)